MALLMVGGMVEPDNLEGFVQLNPKITEWPGLGGTLKSPSSNPQLQKKQPHIAHPNPGFLIFNLGMSGEGNGSEISLLQRLKTQ